MLKNFVRLEHIVADKVYHLVCDPDSPFPALKEALFEFIKYVGNLEDQAKAQQSIVEEKPNVEPPNAE